MVIVKNICLFDPYFSSLPGKPSNSWERHMPETLIAWSMTFCGIQRTSYGCGCLWNVGDPFRRSIPLHSKLTKMVNIPWCCGKQAGQQEFDLESLEVTSRGHSLYFQIICFFPQTMLMVNLVCVSCLIHMERSAGAWGQTIVDLLGILNDSHVMNLLCLKAASLSAGLASVDDAYLAPDVRRANELFTFVVRLCSNRAHSQLHHSFSLPHCFARVFLPTEQERLESREFFRTMSKVLHAVIRARKAKNTKQKLKEIEDFAKRLGTLLRDGEAVDWDMLRLRPLCWATFASSGETKQPCENPFGWLHDAARRSTKTEKMNPYTKYAQLMICPYANTGGSTTLTIDGKDVMYVSNAEKTEFSKMELFDASFEQIPLEGVTPQKIKTEWRPAGFYSQRVAPVAFLAAQRATKNGTQDLDMSKIASTWAGCLLVQGRCTTTMRQRSSLWA